jgi:hypothetical protein
VKTALEICDTAVDFKLGFVSTSMLMPFVEAIQQDAYLAGLGKAGEIVTDYAKLLRGAHVNTNNSCGSINKAILAEMDRVKAK